MPQLNVVIKGKDEFSPTMRECRGAVTDFNQALEIAGKVARTVGQVYEATVGEFLEYADAVDNLSSITGESTESTSRFITVLGDFGIEMGQITAAGRAMRDEGLAPTLETLAGLSDRYLALAPGMARVNFLQETLGRGGAEFVDVLDQGSAAIRARGAAVADGNILTAEEIRQADELQLSMQELNDTWTAFTRTLSVAAIPFIQDTVGELGDLATVLGGEMIPPENLTLLSTFIITIQDVARAMGLWEPAFDAADAAGRTWALGMDNQLDQLDRLPGLADTATMALYGLSREQLQAKLEAREHTDELQRLDQTLDDIDGRHIRATVDIVANWPSALDFLMGEHQGYVDPNAQWGAYAGPGPEVSGGTAPGGGPAEGWAAWAAANPGEFWTPGRAQGGPLFPITEVGEEGTEGIINGMVVPHDLWERLKRMGLEPDFHAVLGGDPQQYYPTISKPKSTTTSTTTKKGTVSGGGYVTGGAAEGAVSAVPVADIVAEVQQASAQESAALVASIPAAAASAASEQGRQQVIEARNIGNDTIVVLRRIEREIAKLNQTFPTVVRDAVERVM